MGQCRYCPHAAMAAPIPASYGRCISRLVAACLVSAFVRQKTKDTVKWYQGQILLAEPFLAGTLGGGRRWSAVSSTTNDVCSCQHVPRSPPFPTHHLREIGACSKVETPQIVKHRHTIVPSRNEDTGVVENSDVVPTTRGRNAPWDLGLPRQCCQVEQ